ncbi:unnamed protein product, partial [Prorocentrum cordatum]
MAVATTSLPSASVAPIGRTSERWRYKVPSAISARTSALGPTLDSDGIATEINKGHRLGEQLDVFGDADTVLGFKGSHSEDPWELNPDFREVPFEFLREELWREVLAAPFHASEAIAVLEARASNAGSRHILRSFRAFNKRHLKLGNELGVILAPFQRQMFASYSIAANVRFERRWIPSEFNRSDHGSRRWETKVARPLDKASQRGRPFEGSSREERAARRAVASCEFHGTQEGTHPFLEVNATAPATQDVYLDCKLELECFVVARALSLATPAEDDRAPTNSPSLARPLMLWILTCLVALIMIVNLNAPMAALMALPFFLAYLRPSEAGGLLEEDLVPPSASPAFFVLCLLPSDRGEVSEVRNSDESIMPDFVEAEWLDDLPRAVKSGSPRRPLFRWASDKSVRRNEAHALTQQQEATPPAAITKRARDPPGQLERLLRENLGGQRKRGASGRASTGPRSAAALRAARGSANLSRAVCERGLAAEGWDYIDGAQADLA